MARTKIKKSDVYALDTITDADSDTHVKVEATPDSDHIAVTVLLAVV